MDRPFELIETDPVIACVGDNGGTDDETIRMGFINSVNILMDAIVHKGAFEDLLVYPIVYNVRHSIELSLKILISGIWQLQIIKKEKNPEEIEAVQSKLHTHDIKALNDLTKEVIDFDRRFPEEYKKLDSFLQFYYFDVDGDAFKYETDKENHPHMISQNISHISMQTLVDQFNEAMQTFERLIDLKNTLLREYRLQTYTKHLSRADIEDISKKLLPYEKWRLPEFDENKATIRKEYGISNKECSEVIDIIKCHRKFCTNIGMELPFGNITDDELRQYAKLVAEYCNFRSSEPKGVMLEADFWNRLPSVQEHNRKLKEISDSISDDTLNLLLTFCDMSPEQIYVEELEKHYIYYADNKPRRIDTVRRLKTKTSYEYVLLGMKECGQVTYRKKLEKDFAECK